MISAKEAKDNTKNRINNLADSELDQIEKEINEAINNGKYEIFLSTIYDKNKKKLRKLGYKVADDPEGFFYVGWM